MAWKEIRNGEPEFRNTSNSGICKLSGKQKIHISYDLIGFIPVDVLTKAEQA